MNNIDWDRILSKHDEYNDDYRRRFMDDDEEDEMTQQEIDDWKADEDED